jgi:hypothetical protein
MYLFWLDWLSAVTADKTWSGDQQLRMVKNTITTIVQHIKAVKVVLRT